MTYYGLGRKKDPITSKISSYGFKTHRHHQIGGKMGSFYLTFLWLWAVSNGQSTLKICFCLCFFFFSLKEQVLIFVCLFLKSQYYQNVAHYVTMKSTWRVPFSVWTSPTQIVLSQKGKKPLSSSSILFSVLQKAAYTGVLCLYLAEDITANHHSYLSRKSSLNKWIILVLPNVIFI